MWRLILLVLLAFFLVIPSSLGADTQPSRTALREQHNKGNYKDAYDGLSKLVLAPTHAGAPLAEDLDLCVSALQNLGRSAEIDDFMEAAIAAHPKDIHLLSKAAERYRVLNHYGHIVAGKYYRGGHRGGDGKYVNSLQRDRVRSLQLVQQAIKALPESHSDKRFQAELYMSFAASMVNGSDGNEAWRLGALTDLTSLPDYDEGYGRHGRWGYYGGHRGAPVNEDGTPVFHKIPKTWDAATSDGERWRWCLTQAQELGDDSIKVHARWVWAEFLREQFGVQTMAYYGNTFFGRSADDDTKKDESSPFLVSTLTDDETIARLANGIKRFRLPDEYNFIKVYGSLSAEGKGFADVATEALATIYENRQQYPKAAEMWRDAIKRFGPGHSAYRQARLEQIVGNWGIFERIPTEVAGKQSTFAFRYRNGKKLTFTANVIDEEKLLNDVKAFIRSKPNNMQWEKIDIANVGHRLVTRDEKKYIGREAAKWSLELQPREKHFDRRIIVTAPLKDAGAYLIKAEMDGGNTCAAVLWIADTAIVKKPLNDGVLFYVADAVTGKPVPKAELEFFGYQHRWVKENTYHTDITEEKGTADGSGIYAGKAAVLPTQRNYLVIARTPGEGGPGRFAYLGFSGLWYSHYSYAYDHEYKRVKPYFITDRPVYRPGQVVKWKLWLNTSKYDADSKSEFAGQSATVHVYNPKGDRIKDYSLVMDDFGGINGEFTLEKDATLGVYSIQHPSHGGMQFRVEEYKKPEFEVKVDAPTEPVALGEKVTATVTAKYYFGAPVASGTARYKITRTAHDARWYPAGKWDWYFEPGYWWFAYDYVWYPGWAQWGCWRPRPWWVWRGQPQPEVVVEGEMPLPPDGTLKLDIDTALAKLTHPDQDHRYEVSVDVTDQSRRVITGTGQVLVARKPFKVYTWVDKGFYQKGDQVKVGFSAQTLDGKGVFGSAHLRLFRVTYDKDNKPVETAVDLGGAGQVLHWNQASMELQHHSLRAAEPGQYRVSVSVSDAKKRSAEGGYVFVVRDNATVATDKSFRFNDIEIVPDKREYKAGETVRLMINTNREDATVLLFVRPSNGVYLPPKLVAMKGKSTVEEIGVTRKDMPNFFVEALTVYNANVYNDAKEIVVPPEDRVLNVSVSPVGRSAVDKEPVTYKPGEKARFQIKVTEPNGEPFNGSAVVSVYDKAVEYISGGSNVPDIRTFFWKWRRHHNPHVETSLSKSGHAVWREKDVGMNVLGVFGHLVTALNYSGGTVTIGGTSAVYEADGMPAPATAAPEAMPTESLASMGVSGGEAKRSAARYRDGLGGAPGNKGNEYFALDKAKGDLGDQSDGASMIEPTVRKNFADTALWVAAVDTSKSGTAEVELTMPENLSTWKTKVWAMGAGTRVGQGETEVITTKNVIVRLQSPRFYVTTDEVVLSANVHNYLKDKKNVRVQLELAGPTLEFIGITSHATVAGVPAVAIDVPAKGEARVDFRVRVVQPGTATVRMKAITNEESDATEMTFPVYIHGMLKTDSFSGAMRNEDSTAQITYTVPVERKPEESRVEIRYSPSLATAMVDALPYMVEYPYGCTEQTLNRFLPTVVTQKVLMEMKVDLAAVRDKRVNLNAQEIGDPQKRAARWKRFDRNPVFDKAEVDAMVKSGVKALTNMQLTDGGWGWFSGHGERSSPHTTAVVVHGLQTARANDVKVDDNVLSRGVAWLTAWQDKQVQWLKNHDAHRNDPDFRGERKSSADATDALVFMVLTDAGVKNKDMVEYLYRDRANIAVYAKAMYGLALHKLGEKQKLEMILQNISQFVVQDDENQTAYLKLPEDNWWWYWYGSDTEANAFYLKLLSRTDAKGKTASGLAKYLINNRKHATYWNSTRDTAYCIEALADFIRASGEAAPDMTVEIAVDGKKIKEVKIDATSLFTFDGTALIEGADVTAGKHTLSFTKRGTGPLYFNAYVTNFTLEDRITRAGLEIKVNRKLYKLTPVDKKIKVEGVRGQAVDQKVEKYARTEVLDMSTLKSGDLCEVELEIDSKNDYEYILLEDMKAAGFEPVEVRSGYNGNDLRAYVEFRDERVCFFTSMLARGKHSVSYRLRAEIPGKFSALPTKASAMYAPELRANSDELKVKITD